MQDYAFLFVLYILLGSDAPDPDLNEVIYIEEEGQEEIEESIPIATIDGVSEPKGSRPALYDVYPDVHYNGDQTKKCTCIDGNSAGECECFFSGNIDALTISAAVAVGSSTSIAALLAPYCSYSSAASSSGTPPTSPLRQSGNRETKSPLRPPICAPLRAKSPIRVHCPVSVLVHTGSNESTEAAEPTSSVGQQPGIPESTQPVAIETVPSAPSAPSELLPRALHKAKLLPGTKNGTIGKYQSVSQQPTKDRNEREEELRNMIAARKAAVSASTNKSNTDLVSALEPSRDSQSQYSSSNSTSAIITSSTATVAPCRSLNPTTHPYTNPHTYMSIAHTNSVIESIKNGDTGDSLVDENGDTGDSLVDVDNLDVDDAVREYDANMKISGSLGREDSLLSGLLSGETPCKNSSRNSPCTPGQMDLLDKSCISEDASVDISRLSIQCCSPGFFFQCYCATSPSSFPLLPLN